MATEMERNAAKYIRGLHAQTLRDRQQLIDLMINVRDNRPHDPNLGLLQVALERLEGISAGLEAFMNTTTGRNWEGQ